MTGNNENERKDRLQQLLETLTDADPEARFGAVRALGTLGDARAIDPLVAPQRGDDDAEVKTERGATHG